MEKKFQSIRRGVDVYSISKNIPVILGSGLVLIILSIPGFFFDASLEGRPTASLNRGQCERLYQHQLKVSLKDKSNPLLPSLHINSDGFQTEKSRQAQIKHCLEHVNRESYQCQLAAQDLLGILVCRKKYNEPDSKKETAKETKKDNGSSDPNRPKEKKDPGRVTSPDEIPVNTGKNSGLSISESNCRKTYEHLLNVYGSSRLVQKRPDAERLLTHWNSKAARTSFHRRCLRVFKAEDLGCIMGSRDTLVIQGCLLRIPR